MREGGEGKEKGWEREQGGARGGERVQLGGQECKLEARGFLS